MVPKLVDSHCHLTDMKSAEAVVADARKSLRALFTCGYSKDTSLSGIKLASRFPGFVYAVAGESPQKVMDLPEPKVEWLDAAEGMVAIGEIGLDRHWGKTEAQLANQRGWFEAQLSIAERRGLPVVIHSREAEQEALEMLASFNVKGVLLHCFSGTPEQAARAADSGYSITIPPMRSKARRKIIKSVSIDYLLLESDAPYLGKDPQSVFDSATYISEVNGRGLAETIELTSANALKFYGVENNGDRQA